MILSILCQVWIYSTYQIFVVLFVVMTMTCFILAYRRWTLIEGRQDINYGKMVLCLIGMFAVSFVVNEFITRVFFSVGSEYLQGQVCWGKISKRGCVGMILTHLKGGFFGTKPFYTPFYFILALAVPIAVIVWARRGKKTLDKLLFVAAAVALQICPFLLSVVTGCEPTRRAQLAYPLVIVCDIVILMNLCSRRYLRALIVALGVLICWTQTEMTTRLIYTDEIRSQEDSHMACEIAQRIGEDATMNKPIVVIGQYDNTLNPSCIRGDLVGTSSFAVNCDALPHYFHSSGRAADLMHVEGYPLRRAGMESVEEARKIAADMPSWPAEGCIRDAGSYVIIKLSPDLWPEDFTVPSLEKASFEEPVTKASDDVMDARIDSVETDDGVLTVTGWVLLRGEDSTALMPEFYLRDQETGTYYKLTTNQQVRQDLVSNIKNGGLYKYSGFQAQAPMEMLEKPLSSYEMYAALENDGQIWMRQLNAPT